MSDPAYLVQILLPKQTGYGKTIPHDWFDPMKTPSDQVMR